MLLYIFIISILLDSFDCFLVVLCGLNNYLFLLLLNRLLLFLLRFLFAEDVSKD